MQLYSGLRFVHTFRCFADLGFIQRNEAAKKLLLIHVFDRIRAQDWDSVAAFAPGIVASAPELCNEYFLKQLQASILEHRDAFFALPFSRIIVDNVFIPLCQRSFATHLRFLAFLLSLQRAVMEHKISEVSIPRLCELGALPALDDIKQCTAIHSTLQSLLFLYQDTPARDALQERVIQFSAIINPADSSEEVPAESSN